MYMHLCSHCPCYRLIRESRTVALVLWVSATLLLGQRHLAAQQPAKSPEKPDKSKAEQPLELPEFVITGTETLDVPGGAKQAPKPSPKLTPQQLTRFNPLDKQTFSLLSPSTMTRALLPQQERNGYVQGEFGMFLSPSIDAGYRIVAGNFDLNAHAGATLSDGHRRNAGFTDVRADLQSQYLAPEKFFFFGGSRTDTYLRANYRNFRFFGADSVMFPELAPLRQSLLMEAGVQTVGGFESLRYDMGVSAESILLQGAHENTLLDAHLAMTTALGAGWHLGGKAAVQFLTASWFAALISPSLVAEYRVSGVSVRAMAGLQTFSYSPFILPNASIHADVAVNSLLSFKVSAFTGARQNSFLQAFRRNPYTATIFLSSKLPPFPLENVIYDVNAALHLHPSQHVTLSLGGNANFTLNKLVFDAAEKNGEFVPSFERVRGFGAWLEAEAQISSADNITLRGNVNVASISLDSAISEIIVPLSYLAPFEASLRYRRRWFEPFSTVLEGVYVSERPVALFSRTASNLPAYLDIRFSAEYEFSPNISAYVRGTNLLNQQIVIWQGFQERGIFIAAGFVITF